MAPITFRNSRIVYYGPHECSNCGVLIVKMGTEWGGTSFTNPEGPIYPNTEWHPHVCDPFIAKKRNALIAENSVKLEFPDALAYETANGKGFVILGEPITIGTTGAFVISPNCTYFRCADDAWVDALRRHNQGLPTWHLDLKKDKRSIITDDLMKLPECPPHA